MRGDVAIIGASIAGLAACVLMRKAGLRVICIDSRPYPHNKVGESLDWSSPRLLRSVGIDLDVLLTDGAATYKNKIVVYETGREVWRATPPPAGGDRVIGFSTAGGRRVEARWYLDGSGTARVLSRAMGFQR